jgi:fructokinase
MAVYGGIEAGGTKFICIIAESPEKILAEIRVPTTNPDDTLGQSIAFFQTFKSRYPDLPIRAIGVSCFGPVDLQTGSATYGYITTTPKPGWANTNIVGQIRNALELPVAFDTDVNGAVMGESHWGIGKGLDSLLYLTIGTGIGGGVLINGKPIHGLVHPEMGHVRLPHDWKEDAYSGYCRYHGDCFEGLAAGPAIEKRWGIKAENLPIDHPAWELEAGYIALALMNFVCTLSPHRIILGGGVMHQPHLLQLVRKKLKAYLNGYVQSPDILEHIDQYIVPPGLKDRSGVLGAIALAIQAGY